MLDKEGNTTALTTINFDNTRIPGRRAATATTDDTVTVPSIAWRDMEGLESGVLGKTTKGSGADSEERFDTEIYLRSLQTRTGTESSGTVRMEKEE